MYTAGPWQYQAQYEQFIIQMRQKNQANTAPETTRCDCPTCQELWNNHGR